jgi:hypothetical protein
MHIIDMAYAMTQGIIKKTCHNRQRIYNNLLDYVMIYYDIFKKNLYLYNFTSITSTIT